MKKMLLKALITCALATGIFTSGIAEAYWCRWQPGYWAYGYWHPARRVCWGGGWGPGPGWGRCAWVPGHWYYGRWIPGHRRCW